MEFTQKLGAAASAVALSIGGVAGAQDAVQWRVEDGGNGHWYQLIIRPKPINWEVARVAATELGGFLACPSTPEENAWIHATLASRPEAWNDAGWVYGPWLGGHRNALSGGEWAWVSGESWTFEAWHSSQPDSVNQTVLSFGGGGPASATWADTGPEEPVTSYLIEWSADCNNDGIVDYGQIRAGQLADSNGNGIPDGCEPDGGNPSDAAQWSSITGGNGHWYAVIPNSAERRSWDACSLYCQQRGGHLVSILSAAENNWVASFALQFNWAWVDHPDGFGPFLGGRQIDGTGEPLGEWTWASGERWSYANWNPGEPNNSGCGSVNGESVLAFTARSGVWNDLNAIPASCVGWLAPAFIIEWSADCNNDGIIDFGQIRAGELEDANGNNIPDCCEGGPSCNCPADIARDGVVNGIDLAAVLNNWGSPGGTFDADVNGDGLVNGVDLAEVLNSWGPCP